MRGTAIAVWMVLGACCVSASVGCAAMEKEEKAVQADLKGGSLGDDALRVAVTAELVKANKANAAIQVEAKSGVVTLKGAGDLAAAQKIAQKVPGVSKVELGDAKGGSATDAKADAKK
jgi:osmotically-inducible protein OsmY